MCENTKVKKFFYFLMLILVNKSCFLFPLNWDDINQRIKQKDKIYFYTGNLCKTVLERHPMYERYIGLSLTKNDSRHIKHDVRKKMLIPDNCVDIYQSEDVFEHIEYKKLVFVINDIYRALKPNGLFRLSIPDYRCDILYKRSKKDKNGKIIFDPAGGGQYKNGRVIGGGHLWFPKIENVIALLEKTKFFTNGKIDFLHYYDVDGTSITKSIDYSKGYIQRTPDNDNRVKEPYRVLSIVVDLYKNAEPEIEGS